MEMYLLGFLLGFTGGAAVGATLALWVVHRMEDKGHDAGGT